MLRMPDSNPPGKSPWMGSSLPTCILIRSISASNESSAGRTVSSNASGEPAGPEGAAVWAGRALAHGCGTPPRTRWCVVHDMAVKCHWGPVAPSNPVPPVAPKRCAHLLSARVLLPQPPGHTQHTPTHPQHTYIPPNTTYAYTHHHDPTLLSPPPPPHPSSTNALPSPITLPKPPPHTPSQPTCFGVIKVEVNDISHFFAAAVHIPVVPVKRQRPAQPAADARQRAAERMAGGARGQV